MDADRYRGAMTRTLTVIIAALTLTLAGCSSGAAAARPSPTVTVTIPSIVTVTVTATPPPKGVAPTKAAPVASPTFDDLGGDMTGIVGEDIPAGVWTVHGAPSDCYWNITKDGSPSDIIDNNIGGGTQRVTLKKGQDFESQGCGVWKKS